MTEVPIPVRMFGPGSQPTDDDVLDVLAVPREVSTFRMPAVPSAEPAPLVQARAILEGFLRELEQWDPVAQSACPYADLAAVPAEVLALVNQMLGEGEVSVRIAPAPGRPEYRIQESVFTGLWRVCAFGGGRPVGDWIEAGALPRAVLAAARAAASANLSPVTVPAGAMNSPALLAEIAAQMSARPPGARAHVVNLTLLPLSPEDQAALDAALPEGPVAIMSRGFGHCRIGSTLARDVWRVRYFNSMNTPILSTIEVVDVPEVALAAPEDLEDSRARLAELVAWMAESE
jgi:hydrogenase-1 operon protein HyaF